MFDEISKESYDMRTLICVMTAWGFNVFSVSEERDSHGGGERSYEKNRYFHFTGALTICSNDTRDHCTERGCWTETTI